MITTKFDAHSCYLSAQRGGASCNSSFSKSASSLGNGSVGGLRSEAGVRQEALGVCGCLRGDRPGEQRCVRPGGPGHLRSSSVPTWPSPGQGAKEGEGRLGEGLGAQDPAWPALKAIVPTALSNTSDLGDVDVPWHPVTTALVGLPSIHSEELVDMDCKALVCNPRGLRVWQLACASSFAVP